jgi:large subunit ribosomal protein L25
MKSVSLKGQKRENLGKKESKKLRANNIIPAVLYGGDEVLHFAIPFSELRKIVYTPNVYLVDLEIEGEVHIAIMQDIQWHPVEEQALHVDFLRVSEDKPVKIDITVNIQGMAAGVKSGGKQNKNMRTMRVKALAKDLPDYIDIDVTKLEIGQSIKVGDLSIENLEFLDNSSSMIVSVISSRAAKAAMGALPEDEEEAEEGEVEEGAEGEATETTASEE